MIVHDIQLNRNIKLLVGALLLIFICSCNGNRTSKTSCRELFEKHYEINVQMFMKAMPDEDPVIARKKGECMLNKLYKIDSTFVLKKGDELHEFISKNFHYLREYDSIH